MSNYEKQNFVSGQILKAEYLNNIENGFDAEIDRLSGEMDKIILGLSDPLEAEGNPLVIKPVGGLPFDSVVSKFTPKQEGSGDPYPVGGGSQLCNFTDHKNYTSSGITLTSSNGVVTLSGTATGTLTFGDGSLPVGTTGTFFISGSDGDVLVYAKVTSSDGTNKWYSNQSFTLDGSETRVSIYVQVNPGKTVGTTVYPMLNAGTSALPWEPYSNIRPFIPYTKLEMTRAGKNLLPNIATTTTDNGIHYTINNDGTVVVNGTCTSTDNAFLKVNPNLLLPAGSYILNGGYDNGSSTICSLYVYDSIEKKWYNCYKDEDVTFTLNTNRKVEVYILVRNGITMSNAIFRPMIRHASITDPTFEPYQGDTYTDTLEAPMYGGERDWVKGELDDTHCCVEFTGNETWHASTSTPNAFYLTYGENTELFPYGFKTSNYNTVLRHRCSHYMATLYSNYSLNNVCVIYAGSRGDTFQIKDNRFSTVAEWVAYLAEQKLNGTPVQASFESLAPPLPPPSVPPTTSRLLSA